MTQARAIVEALADRFAGDAAGWDIDQALDPEVLRWAAARGLFGAFMPPDQGGWTLAELGVLFEGLGSISASLGSAINVQHMAGRALARWASPDQAARWLPAIGSGRVQMSFCVTEAAAGNDIEAITSEVWIVDGRPILRGAKRWITMAAVADLFLVFARQDGAPIACLCPRERPGLTITPIRELLGLRAAHLAALDFHECALEADAIVGRPGFGFNLVAAEGLLHGRLNVAWMACGMLRATLERLCARVSERSVFGRPLIDHGQVRRAIARLGVDLEAARALCRAAVGALQGAEVGASEAVIAAKYFACRAAAEHCGEALRLFGAAGCHEPNDLARFYRDAKVFELIEGASEALEQLLAGVYARSARRAAAENSDG